MILSLLLALTGASDLARIQASLPASPFHARLEAAGRALLGRPYLLGPMGEGDTALGDARPRINLDSLDCVTFIEQAEALARARDTADFLTRLDSIRYRDGLVGWATRNHWMECGWFSSNRSRVRLVELPGSIAETRTLGLRAFYGARGIQRHDSALTLRYLPREAAIEWLSRPGALASIHGIGLVGKVPTIFLLHTGFLVPSPEGLLLRHASQSGQVKQEPAAAYLRSKAKFKGIVVWEYLP